MESEMDDAARFDRYLAGLPDVAVDLYANQLQIVDDGLQIRILLPIDEPRLRATLVGLTPAEEEDADGPD